MFTRDYKNLEGVKIGDVFMRQKAGWHDVLERIVCEKVTPKQCVIGGTIYRIADAREIGARTGYHTQGDLEQFDEYRYSQSKRKAQLRATRSALYHVAWKDMTDEDVLKIWNIIPQEHKR